MLLGFVFLLNGVLSSEEKLLEYYRESCWLSPKVRVETKNGLRGIFANEKIEDGELLMSSRKGCKICWEDALVEFPVLGYYVPLVSSENWKLWFVFLFFSVFFSSRAFEIGRNACCVYRLWRPDAHVLYDSGSRNTFCSVTSKRHKWSSIYWADHK